MSCSTQKRFQKHRHLFKYFGEINALPGSNGLRMGLITRNITNNPTDKPRRLFERHAIDVQELDILAHIPLKQGKLQHFREVRTAIVSGCHHFMASCGFEDYERLTLKIGVPPEIISISRSPSELHERLGHTLCTKRFPTDARESEHPLIPEQHLLISQVWLPFVTGLSDCLYQPFLTTQSIDLFLSGRCAKPDKNHLVDNIDIM